MKRVRSIFKSFEFPFNPVCTCPVSVVLKVKREYFECQTLVTVTDILVSLLSYLLVTLFCHAYYGVTSASHSFCQKCHTGKYNHDISQFYKRKQFLKFKIRLKHRFNLVLANMLYSNC